MHRGVAEADWAAQGALPHISYRRQLMAARAGVGVADVAPGKARSCLSAWKSLPTH